jgi:hypothetical protein
MGFCKVKLGAITVVVVRNIAWEKEIIAVHLIF